MKKSLLLLTGILCIFLLSAQTKQGFCIQVLDANMGEGIEAASVLCNHAKYITNALGICQIVAAENNLLLHVHHLSYMPKDTVVHFHHIHDTIKIFLTTKNSVLKNITVKSFLVKKNFIKAQSTLQGQLLDEAKGQNMALAISGMPGVGLLQTGANISKPVLHGMHSNRLLILNNDIRQEGQQWGADHAPEIDPSIAQNITVIKGAESVRYGADAIAGVVSVNPPALPFGKGISGSVDVVGNSNGQSGFMSAMVHSGFTKNPLWAWRVQGSVKRGGDLKTAEYFLNNTGIKENNFSVAAGFKNANYGLDVYTSLFNTETGVFFGSHIGNLEELLQRFETGRPLKTFPFSYAIDAPKQHVKHQLLKGSAFWNLPFGGKLMALYAFQKNHRMEYDVRRGDKASLPATDLILKTHTLDLIYEKHFLQRWNTMIGYTHMHQENESKRGNGVVPIIPNFASINHGVFGTLKYKTTKWQAEAGIRYDNKHIHMDGFDINGKRYGGKRSFDNLTYNAGLFYAISPSLSISSNVGWAWRAPQPNELYSEGIHHGAGIYMRGDSLLKAEKGWKWIASLMYQKERFKIELNPYWHVIDNYIYEQPTKKTRTLFSGVFPIFQYMQAPALFYGIDAYGKYDFLKIFELETKASLIRATQRDTKKYFPFIPADRVTNSLQWNMPSFKIFEKNYFQFTHHWVCKQTRFDPDMDLVPATPGAYGLIDLKLGTQMKWHQVTWKVILSVHNITNKLYKDYTNRLRYYAHDIGRDFQLTSIINF